VHRSDSNDSLEDSSYFAYWSACQDTLEEAEFEQDLRTLD
jgi:hypothetical protein